jgi:hypothetical protein
MAWVVKAWKPDVLAAAERDARRARREARRETADAAAYLLVLEDLAAQLREDARGRRRELAPAPLPIPRRRAAHAPGEITARRGRATLRDSPLGELFKSTS